MKLATMTLATMKLATLAAAGTALLSACNSATDENPAATASIAGTSWTVAMLEGQAPATGRGGAPTMAFDTEGRVSGSTGCNSFSGGYVLGPEGALRLGGEGAGLATTRMACSPELNGQEATMLRVLGVVASHVIDAKGRLVLMSATGETLLEATPQDAA